MAEVDVDRYLFYAKTVDSGAFKTLSECLKTIFSEICWKIEPLGIKSNAVSKDNNILMHMVLNADKFQVYHCAAEKKIGLDAEHFFRIMRTLVNNDILTLYIERKDENRIGIVFDHAEKKRTLHYKLKLLDSEMSDVRIQAEDFDSIITLPSGDLSKILRDIAAIDSKRVDFQSVGNKLVFRCQDSTGIISQEMVLGENTGGLEIAAQDEQVFAGVYNLKDLVIMSKCTGLCSTVRLYNKNDYPLLCRFSVADLGELTFAFTPLP